MSYEVSDLKTLGIFGAIAIPALAIFGVVYNRRPQINITTLQQSNQNDESISRALDEYTDLIEKAKSDRDNIWQILSEYDAEFTAHMSCIAAEHPKLSTSKVIVPGVTHFQKKTNTMSKLECARFTQLLNHYRELAKTYPIDGFINWSTSEAEANLTLSMVEEAYANYEAHHEKLLSVAEELLTESGITVQRARNVIGKLGGGSEYCVKN